MTDHADFSDRRAASLSPKVRNFIVIVLVSVNGAHPNLMPDLTASLDVELARSAGALVVPRLYLQMKSSNDVPEAAALVRGILDVAHRGAGDFTSSRRPNCRVPARGTAEAVPYIPRV